MTYEEFTGEFLALIDELPNDPDEAVLVTGFLNEEMAMNDFRIPMEELMMIIKHVKPAIAGYMDLIGNREFKRLFKSDLTLHEALQRIGANPNYFNP